ncbi:MAG: histidine phosphatase family protein [Pseudomonadota bacterium]
MATELWLVRHGQAAFQSDDYDRLTDLGWQQARWLGTHLVEMDRGFDRIAAGTLRRQQETATALADALGGTVDTVSGLEEYDAHGLMARAGFTDRDPALSRAEHFRRLRGVLIDWSEGRAEGPETWGAFRARVMGAVADLTATPGQVIAASSGGAIAMVLAEVLGLDAGRMVDLNLQARNTGISRLVFTSRTVYVNMVNAVPHLERPDRRHAETYS